MELFAILFLWPFIILSAGLVFVSLSDIFPWGLSVLWFPALLVIGILFSVKGKSHTSGGDKEQTNRQQLYRLRRAMIIFSIAILFPIFIRYLVDAFNGTLAVIIFGLLLSFGFLVWGLFVKQHTAIMVSNIAGGAIALFYLYVHIWALGEGPRIIAAGVGLLIAVVMSVIKLREKLV